ncbi:cytochrome P450 [Hysterangium stoloniferum]|nr:cytochrome P450 [Hysterangium stoloniferum]
MPYYRLDALLAGLTCLFVYLLWNRSRLSKHITLPPGPPRRPIVGNLYDLPKIHEWETYTSWAKQYGDVVYVRVLQQQMIFVNSVSAAKELFEKRSSIYSDRFDFPMLNDLMGFNWSFVLMRYGDRWRRNRRMFHQHFHPGAIKAYQPLQIKHARDLLKRLRETPHDFMNHTRQLSGAITMDILYGIKVKPSGDPYLKLAEEAFKVAATAGNPGSYIVDTFPILKYVPEWMPGAGFKVKARIWKEELISKMPVMPHEECKRTMAAGNATVSFTASALERLARRTDEGVAEEEETIRGTAATGFGAGADTTTVALQWFIIAMIKYPEVQKKAQAELDSVLGIERLPTFEDRPSLPYINAICLEIQRWHPILPLGVAHGLTEDDVYNNMLIPKGTIVVGNAWAMLHDEKVYGPKVDEFNPERFFLPGVKPDISVAFGFGRRICPGRYIAENTIFLAVASLLKVFNFSHAKGADGKELLLDITFTSGAISRPDPFQCSILPRSEEAESLLKHFND